MAPDSTPEQRPRATLVVLGFCVLSTLVCAWRWRVVPRASAPSWRTPGECVERYRFTATTLVGERQAERRWQLTIRADDDQVRAEIHLESEDPEVLAESARVRELWYAATGVGPAAPDLPCRVEIRDPLEDALAFGWPALPGPESPASVGEGWVGHAVAGRCHAWACADAEGRLSAVPGCRAGPWRERLVSAGPSLALVHGRWRVGSDPASGGAAILTSRTVLIGDGRPVHGLGTVDSRISDARLELELERLDDCPPPTEPSALARVRARLQTSIGKSRRPRT